MADNKEKPKAETKNYTGKGITKEIQEKVDSYMDIGKGTTGPPLLPTDKLPKSISDNKPKEEKPPALPQPEVKSAEPKEPEPTAPPPKDPLYEEWPDPEAARKAGLNLEDRATNKAVDEIVAAESDQLIEAQDEVIAEKQQETAPPPKKKGRLGAFLKSKKLALIFWLLFIGLMVAMAIPSSRYFILNSLGVRASTSMIVVDRKTGQPLKDVKVSLDGQSAQTGRDGEARLYQVHLGTHKLSIEKPAFASLSQDIIIGWGSNPLGHMELKPVGVQYRFLLSDFLSGLPINKAEATSGEANAVSNKKGELTLVVEKTGEEMLDVTLQADGYRKEKVKVSPGDQQVKKLSLVTDRKHAFVSKRSGTYDLYKTDIDGKNEKLILAGTGFESEDSLVLVNHPTNEVAAFVSIRGEARSSTGELLSTLQVVNLDTNDVKSVVSSSRIQIVDWVGNRLIYVKEQNDKAPDDPSRHKLMSYDYVLGSETTLASATYFNDVSVAQGVVYYSPAGGGKDTGFYSVSADGSGRRAITDKEVWNIFRTSYDNLRVSLGQQWYDFNLDNGSFIKADGPPPVLKSRIYYDSPNRKRSIWSEDRDGKGTLILFDHGNNEDRTILSQSGLGNPLRWLNDHSIVFRITDGQETSDYALSLDGGEPKKITDVTDVTGIDKWYFY